jgi:tetratricopeptide (TPR) repeat protein
VFAFTLKSRAKIAQGGKLTGSIFISYRHEDSAANAGRICDHLSTLFGKGRVFMDVEAIQPGQNFSQTIDQTIADCSAVLVIIGPRWMEAFRNREQKSQPDYVYHEIESALTRKIVVIPVLVGGASMAQLTDLPENLAELPLHEAAEVRDTTFREDCARLASVLATRAGLKLQPGGSKTDPKKLVALAGGSLAVVALLFALLSWMGIGPLGRYQERRARIQHLLSTARTQVDQAEYEAAFRTCQDALKLNPSDRAAMDRQVDAAMLWLENFHVIVPEGQKAEDLAGPALSEIMLVLDAGLARTNGYEPRAADVLAHLGWAHWLNQHIAYKEFGSTAEQAMRKALSIDPSNVYANAMLGNWMLQNHGRLDEILRHFDLAVKSGKERPLVRSMQLGGMIYDDDPGVRAELIRVANQMRIAREPMPEEYQHRILSNYSPTNGRDELVQTLAAVPQEEAWATYLWLDGARTSSRESDYQKIQHEFIRANLLELGDKPAEALEMFKTLQRELKSQNMSGRLANHVAASIARLSRLPPRPA